MSKMLSDAMKITHLQETGFTDLTNLFEEGEVYIKPHTLVSKSIHLVRSTVQTPCPKWVCWLLLTDARQFTVQKLDQLYVLVSSAHKTTCRDMTCTV